MDYIQENKKLWNERTKIHILSSFYDNKKFLETKNSLNEIELSLLGDLKGKTILHLQCHFGQDSLSLAARGAKVTGVDFSEEAISIARSMDEKLQLDVDFICCDIYELQKNCSKNFDIIFTSYGTIVWLADLDKWAQQISYFLKPGGRFIFVDFHPMLLTMDDALEFMKYDYFNNGPIHEITEQTYTDGEKHSPLSEITWNHPFSEVFTSLLHYNMRLLHFQEYEYSPYACFKQMEESSPGKFVFSNKTGKLPLVYSMIWEKEGIS